MINAEAAAVGQTYKTTSGIIVEVVEKNPTNVAVKSYDTGHIVPVPLNYPLLPVDSPSVTSVPEVLTQEIDATEKDMPTDNSTITVEAPKTRKVKKSNIVDQGLTANLSADEIVKNVLATFPEVLEKSIRNLISVRRSKLKKTA